MVGICRFSVIKLIPKREIFTFFGSSYRLEGLVPIPLTRGLYVSGSSEEW
jgi:hypothetical protein